MPVTIQMPGSSESLNAARAAAIFLLEYVCGTFAAK